MTDRKRHVPEDIAEGQIKRLKPDEKQRDDNEEGQPVDNFNKHVVATTPSSNSDIALTKAASFSHISYFKVEESEIGHTILTADAKRDADSDILSPNVKQAVEERAADETQGVEKEEANEKQAVEKGIAYETKAVEKETFDKTQAVEKETFDETQAVEKETFDETQAVQKEAADKTQAVEKVAADKTRAVEEDSAVEIQATEKKAADETQPLEKEPAEETQSMEKEAADKTLKKSFSFQSGSSQADHLVMKGNAYKTDGDSSGTLTPGNEKVSAGKHNWKRHSSKIEELQDSAKCTRDDSNEVLSESSNDKQLFQNKNKTPDYPYQYLYRLLRNDENPCRDGIKAKSPNSDHSVEDHVRMGSKGFSSKYISTSATRDGVSSLRRRCRESPIPDVVKINCEGLQNVQYFDLTTDENKKRYLSSSKSLRYVKLFDEVLVEGYIPASHCEIITDI